jgi:hypothetical protein
MHVNNWELIETAVVSVTGERPAAIMIAVGHRTLLANALGQSVESMVTGSDALEGVNSLVQLGVAGAI